jgi:hypothetical protein
MVSEQSKSFQNKVPRDPAMKNLLGLALLAFAAYGQDSITRSSTTTNVIKAIAAGGMVCTFINQVPASPSGIHVECVAGTSSMTQDSVLASSGNGQVGSFNSGTDSTTWIFTLSGSAVKYDIAVNGKRDAGTF